MPKLVSNALTPLSVKNAKPGTFNDGGGLRLIVKEGGARSWVYRYTMAGRTRDIGLGNASGNGAVTLAAARDLAAQYRSGVRAGVDPLAERDREAAETRAKAQAGKIASVTFRDVAAAYIAAHESAWRNAKHRAQWSATLATYAYPVMGDLPVADVDTAHVMAVLEPIWYAKSETASRLRGRIELILDSARARGYRKTENPARWRGHIAAMLPARAKLTRGHHAALPYSDMPAFVAALRTRDAIAALALEFAILSACRSGEVINATWDEIDLTAKMWAIRPERMKAGREHRVPLTPRMMEILETMRPLGGDHIFIGNKGRPLSSMAMAMLLRRMGRTDITVHGFRSSFRDWAAECTAFPNEVCEMALAHTIGNAAEAAYRRGDLLEKRRKLLEAWAEYCGGTSNVIRLVGAA
jgi:integrase